jgi:hypothetical protein
LADGDTPKNDGHTANPNIISYLYRLFIKINDLGMTIREDMPIMIVPRRSRNWMRKIVEDRYSMSNQHTVANVDATSRPNFAIFPDVAVLPYTNFTPMSKRKEFASDMRECTYAYTLGPAHVHDPGRWI